VGVTSVTARNSGDGKRKGKRNMYGVSVRAEADFPSNESFKGSKQRVVAGFPCPVNPLWSLSGVHVASALDAVFTVNLVTAMDARSADQTVKSGTYRFCGGNRFD